MTNKLQSWKHVCHAISGANMLLQSSNTDNYCTIINLILVFKASSSNYQHKNYAGCHRTDNVTIYQKIFE